MPRIQANDRATFDILIHICIDGIDNDCGFLLGRSAFALRKTDPDFLYFASTETNYARKLVFKLTFVYQPLTVAIIHFQIRSNYVHQLDSTTHCIHLYDTY